ncbi:MAG: hydroxylamine oxidoreductase [Bacteroidetes bacterium]|nr:hydroxylamine oxidoreductase [Bacteroidota bacterium]
MSTSLNTKRTIIGVLSIAFLAVLLFAIFKETQRQIPGYKAEPVIDAKTKHCIGCHSEKGEGKVITEQWKESNHAQVGVGCVECHGAEKDDIDGYEHHGDFIATIVTPKDCGKCHEKETAEFTASHHADAGAIMGSLDNVLAEVVEGHASFNGGANPAAAQGCWQCHGSRVELLKDAEGNPIKNDDGILQFDPKTWPNTGIGRVNLDGSKGSCAACHNRHHFSVEQVRQPENCGKCHMGPDHPQLEIYEESKHGINYHAHREEMNLSAKPWIVGEDYNAAPTCATCHMSATPDQPITHEIGSRISWTLRPKVSEKIDASEIKKYKKLGQPLPEDFLTWEQRRNNMKNVCSQCHTKAYILNFYTQFDNSVNMYNEKYGKPGLALMNALKANNMISSIPFDDVIEWDWFYLWHHEGRRMRHGAAMMGPDYVQWHGNFDLAENFYTKMVPEIKELIEKARKSGNTKGAMEVEKLLDETLNSDMHKWFLGKTDPEEVKRRKEASKQFRERYAN